MRISPVPNVHFRGLKGKAKLIKVKSVPSPEQPPKAGLKRWAAVSLFLLLFPKAPVGLAVVGYFHPPTRAFLVRTFESGKRTIIEYWGKKPIQALPETSVEIPEPPIP